MSEFTRLVQLEARVTDQEGDSLAARWEFGRELLAKRNGKERLPIHGGVR